MNFKSNIKISHGTRIAIPSHAAKVIIISDSAIKRNIKIDNKMHKALS